MAGITPTEFVLENVQDDPGVQIFVKRLFQLKLLGPFAIIAFVSHVDTGLGHFQFIQGLDGF